MSKSAFFAALLLGGIGAAAHAGGDVLVQASDCTILAGGPGFGTCVETYNQAGLAANYISGATAVQPFVGTTTHTTIFAGFEWFSNQGTSSASVSYLVNAPSNVLSITSFHLWNEESSGIGDFDLWFGAFAGDRSDLVVAGGVPTDHPLADYLADSWHFAPRPTQGWWTLDMRGCPQPNVGSFAACAIGEVAWGGPKVPEPATWALMIAGFGLVGAAARTRRLATALHRS